MSSPAVLNIPDNIAEVQIGLVCIKIDINNGQCKTWALMKQPEPLLPKISKQQQADIVLAILQCFVVVWFFLLIKRAIKL